MRGWYCVQTNPREESRAHAHISDAGLNVWFPKINVTKSRHGRPVRLLEPLFPSYLFVTMDPTLPSEWTVVRWGRGVRDIVSDGTGPPLVPEPVMGVSPCEIRRAGDRGVVASHPRRAGAYR